MTAVVGSGRSAPTRQGLDRGRRLRAARLPAAVRTGEQDRPCSGLCGPERVRRALQVTVPGEYAVRWSCRANALWSADGIRAMCKFREHSCYLIFRDHGSADATTRHSGHSGCAVRRWPGGAADQGWGAPINGAVTRRKGADCGERCRPGSGGHNRPLCLADRKSHWRGRHGTDETTPCSNGLALRPGMRSNCTQAAPSRSPVASERIQSA